MISLQPINIEESIGIDIYYSFGNTSMGNLIIATTPKGLCWLNFVDSDELTALENLKHAFPKAHFSHIDNQKFQDIIKYIDTMPERNIDVTLHVKGTKFQIAVWHELIKIKRGTTTTYSAIAHNSGYPKAYQAVGSAVGKNPIVGIIPCHRVLPVSHKLGNFSCGTFRKARMLDMEGAHYIPNSNH